jgi:protein-disulfide isomerase
MKVGKHAALAAVIVCAAFMSVAAPAAEQVYQEFIEGNPKAKVTVIEYASLTCSHCADFHLNGYPLLKKDYIDTGKIQFIYRDMPGDGLALGAALLARCVPGGKGKAMIDMMFKNQKDWVGAANPLEPLQSYANLAGLDKAGLDQCLKNTAIVTKIQDVQDAAINERGVKATPTFFVGELRVDGSDYAALKKLIDLVLP